MAKYIDADLLIKEVESEFDLEYGEVLINPNIFIDLIDKYTDDTDISKLRPLHIDNENVAINLANAMELSELKENNNWIPVEEGLPQSDDIDCIVKTENDDLQVAYYRNDIKAWDNTTYGFIQGKVIEWKPI